MKRLFLTLAVIGYLVCLVVAWLPTLSALYPTAAYAGMSACALVALVCCSRAQQWVAVVALLLGLGGGLNCWQHNRRIYASMLRMSAAPPAAAAPQQTNTNR